jgi:3-dehydroquinate synthetase
MYLANSISVKRGLLSIQKHNHITENILNPVLFHGLEIPQLDNTLILEAMKKDKKRFDDRLIIILLSETLELMEYNDLAHEEVAHAFLDLYGWVAE